MREEVRVRASWLRVTIGSAAFLLVAIGGFALLDVAGWGDTLERLQLLMLVAIPAGVAAYALIEWWQTGRIESITRQFDTRTLVLMPVAMALNIVLGTAVASALKLPIYLDSIGTILVAALAGPLAGAATGFLTNIIWTFLAPAPFASPFAAPFAVVAVAIGLLAGTFARWGWLRPRPGSSGRQIIVGGSVALALIAIVAALALAGWSSIGEDVRPVSESDDGLLFALGWVALVLVIGTAVGLLALLFWRRDLAAAYVVVAGVITGVVAAFIAAPIAAGLFGGVTGGGADFVVAAFRQAGADLQQAVLGQALVSDPIDKVVTYFVVYLILGAMAERTKARFPQGEYLLPLTPDHHEPNAAKG
jgi:energy-coupling factor transport system substrate-specific component